MHRKSIIIYLFTLLPSCSLFGQPGGYPDFELVESIPLETALDNPDIRNTHEVWLEMIGQSKKSLDIEQFYVSNKEGEPLEDIIVAIINAAKRGVRVRLIADARMYRTYPGTVDRLSAVPHIETRVIDFGKVAGGIQHSKYFIVDGEQIFLGSQNFDWRALKHIHELGFRVRHTEAVAAYRQIFELDWELAAAKPPHEGRMEIQTVRHAVPFIFIEGGNDTVTFVPTYSPKNFIPDTVLWDETNIVKLIDSARREVLLQFLSFSALSREGGRYDVLDAVLRRAASRGVKVEMIVSDWEKGREESLMDLARVPGIEVKFSVIPEWSGGYIPYARVEHCKYIVADGSSVWLGTSNGEKSYFHTSRNIGVIVWNEKIGGIVKRVFKKSWEGPYTEFVRQDVHYERRRHGEE
jgi:phosphatidylserine/phosphatidylglycerophosphate/cardiolipin synthase-like enzyme